MNWELDQILRNQSSDRVTVINYGNGFLAVKISHTTIDSSESLDEDQMSHVEIAFEIRIVWFSSNDSSLLSTVNVWYYDCRQSRSIKNVRVQLKHS